MDKKMVKTAALMTVLTIIFTLAVCIVDVRAVGPANTEVGFASLNYIVSEKIGFNELFYQVTEVCGYLAICVCVFFACLGLKQVITRKNLFKLDRDIACLAVIYIVTILAYVIFDKLALNYRPMLMPGETELEASFPSSHTMLICTVMGTAIIEIKHRLEGKKLCKILLVFSWALILITVAGRLLSGVHWITDIFGGILYSLTFIFWFLTFAYNYDSNN